MGRHARRRHACGGAGASAELPITATSSLLTAFCIVLGTLVIQGLTLKPLLRALNLRDEDPVGRELTVARERAFRAALASLGDDRSPAAEFYRQQFKKRLVQQRVRAGQMDASGLAHVELRRTALQAARQALIAMRDADEIGDDAFRGIERELDWIEMAIGGNE